MAMGRKRRPKVTKIARGIECDEEFCYNCDRLREIKEDPKHPYIWCLEWERELAPAFNDSRAERCSACHMGQRYAEGKNIYI